MKTVNKKYSKTQLIRSLVISIGVAAVLYFVITYFSRQKPDWSYVQAFNSNNLLTTVKQTSTNGKTASSHREFFIIHGFDFQSGKEIDPVEVNIDEKAGGDKKFIGSTVNHLWFMTPTMTAVNMASGTPEVLDFPALNQLITENNMGKISSVLEIYPSEHHIIVTNQDGDKFYLNAKTFQAVRDLPQSKYEYIPDYHLSDKLPGTTQFEDDYIREEFTTANGLLNIALVPEIASNNIKSILVSTVVEKEESVQENAETDKPSAQQIQLGTSTYIYARPVGIKDNKFVFTYMKTNEARAHVYLAWFDLSTNKITKEMDLMKEGFGENVFSFHVSRDEKYIYFTEPGIKPARYEL